MILLLDNYDSFVFNLARYIEELGCPAQVVRSDRITVPEIEQLAPTAIVISPGPCTPKEAGVSVDTVRHLGPTVPILGVCLGHQAIAAAYGGRVTRAAEPVHGRNSLIEHSGSGLFAGLPQPLTVARYHSLIVDEHSLPPDLQVTARTADGIVMALEHTRHPVLGVQFHPESILTDGGHRLLANFLQRAGQPVAAGPEPEQPPPAENDDFYRQPIAAEARRPW